MLLKTRFWLFALLLSVFCVACDSGGAAEDESRDVDPGLLEDAWEDDVQEETAFENTGFIPASARPDQIKALERANWYRWQSGLPQMDMIEQINEAAQAHCDYYVTHLKQYQSTGLSPHNENPSWAEGFTGEAPWDRTAFFGYNNCSSEVIAFLHDPIGAVDGWMATLYHRIPFMDAKLVSLGYGAAGSGTWSNSSRIDTMDFGTTNAKGGSYQGPEMLGVYPPEGGSGIPVSFDGLESPEPIMPPGGWPSGTIVTLTWSTGATFAVEEHAIWAEDDQVELPHVWADSFNDPQLAGTGTIAMYAHDPLKPGTKYWVHIKGKKGGKDFDKQWFFHTERYP